MPSNRPRFWPHPGLLLSVAAMLVTAGCTAASTNDTASPAVSAVPSAGPAVPLAAPSAVIASPVPLSPSVPSARPTPVLATGEATLLSFDEFYDGYDIRTGLKLSEKLRSLDGQRVRIEGYMAPPLKPELDFFVLTRIRLAYCPFCSTAGDWPDDIAVVYLLGDPMRTTDRPLRLEGTLELGPATDPETGMLSIVRVYADAVELL
jgi:hypothetical protein